MSEVKVCNLSGGTETVGDEVLAEFQASILGQIIKPDDSEYNETRQIWNAMIDRRPGLIVRCSGTADVMRSVQFAKQHKLMVSIRGAGHNIAGMSLRDDAMLIDLSAMNSVQVDPEARVATAGPGVTLGDLDHETQAFGLALPVGINSTTGVGGLTLGGGFGWISRSLGMTVDNLIGVEVVTASGERIYCDENNHTELFWATRGGGGNFGIVTSFKFKLHPINPMLMCGPIVFPFDQAKSVLHAYRDFCANAPDELTVWAILRDAPPLPFLSPENHGSRVVVVVAVYNGDQKAGEKAIAPLRELGQSIGDGFGPAPFWAFQQAFDPLLTPGSRNYWKSHNFTSLSDELIDNLVENGANLPSSQSEIFIAHLGGVINRVAPDATAYPHRDAEFVMNVHTRWDDASEDSHCVDWARRFYESTKPFATGGVYVNFISEGEDRASNAYGSNYDRLSKVKAKYDPGNFFRVNQNITPT